MKILLLFLLITSTGCRLAYKEISEPGANPYRCLTIGDWHENGHSDGTLTVSAPQPTWEGFYEYWFGDKVKANNLASLTILSVNGVKKQYIYGPNDYVVGEKDGKLYIKSIVVNKSAATKLVEAVYNFMSTLLM